VQAVTHEDPGLALGDARHPAWSPDGAWILIGHLLVHPDGSGLRLLPVPNACSCEPYSWSPEGTRLALDGADGALYMMNVDGSGFRQLTKRSGAYEPAWSPDGTKIVFTRFYESFNFVDSNIYPERDLWTINTDGTGEMRLTSGPWPDTVRTWRPAP
jgi:dipeptidyl aminopeptidase/acylaminoacyl peptidase